MPARLMCSRPTSPGAVGVTAFLQVAALCEAHHIDLSGHCGPAIHLHAACAAPRFAIWNGFTTMSGSNTCCSTARRRHAMASSDRTCRGLAWG